MALTEKQKEALRKLHAKNAGKSTSQKKEDVPFEHQHHTKRYRQTNVADLVKGTKLNGKVGRPSTRAKQAASGLVADVIAGKRVIKEAGDELPDHATPLDIMLMAMRSAYKVGGSLMAFPYAEKAAPYLHARIAQVQIKPPDDSKGALVFGWLSDLPPIPRPQDLPPDPGDQAPRILDGMTKLLDN